MDADEWNTTDDVLQMISTGGHKASRRRLQLFKLACWEGLSPPQERSAGFNLAKVLAESYLLNSSTGDHSRELEPPPPLMQTYEALGQWEGAHPHFHWGLATIRLSEQSTDFMHAWQLVLALRQATSPTAIPEAEARHSRSHADLVREVLGPWRKPRFLARWRTETVRLLAEGIAADQAYDRLPILADALEEADCDNLDLLIHCRGPGPHVRGCWALDLVRNQF